MACHLLRFIVQIYEVFSGPLHGSHKLYQVSTYILVAVGSSGILKAKQKLGVTFNFNKQDVIDFMKFSKMTMCRASEANSEK